MLKLWNALKAIIKSKPKAKKLTPICPEAKLLCNVLRERSPETLVEIDSLKNSGLLSQLKYICEKFKLQFPDEKIYFNTAIGQIRQQLEKALPPLPAESAANMSPQHPSP